jgi:paraquat-inducible protein A
LILVACPDCDLLQRVPEPEPGARACCVRCSHVLMAGGRDATVTLALCVTALITLVVANTTSLMGLSVLGRQSSTTIIGGALEMWRTGEQITAVIVAFCALIAPLVYIAFLLTVLIATRRPPAPPWVGELLRWSNAMRGWAMLEVMMLGILVALVKIAEIARVEPGIGMFAVFALMLLFPAIVSRFDPDEVWRRIAWADGERLHEPDAPAEATQ